MKHYDHNIRHITKFSPYLFKGFSELQAKAHFSSVMNDSWSITSQLYSYDPDDNEKLVDIFSNDTENRDLFQNIIISATENNLIYECAGELKGDATVLDFSQWTEKVESCFSTMR